MKQALLEKGKYYHIYNKGRQGENLFRENENYDHFLRLYEKYIDPIAETFAWVLLGNQLACPAGRFSFINKNKND